jgi:hypothetical protein
MLVIAPACESEVAKRIDIPAAAMFAGVSVDQLSDLDLSYTRPFGSRGTPCRLPRGRGAPPRASQRRSPPTSETAYGRSRAAPAGDVLTAAGRVGVEPVGPVGFLEHALDGGWQLRHATLSELLRSRARATSEHMGGVTLARPELSE